MSNYKNLMGIAKNLVNEGNLIAFGKPLEGQIDIFQEKIDGIPILEKFYNNSLADAYLDLLNNALCYVEVPDRKWTGDMNTLTYDKYLATRSREVLKTWLGETILTDRYENQINKVCEVESTFLLKPYKTKDGVYKVTVPKTPVKLNDKLRIYPISVLNTFFKKINELSSEKILQITYQKDNRTKRVIQTTRSKEILSKIYESQDHINMVLGSITKDFASSDAISRGYIKVVEANASKFDTGVRAVNLARLLEVKEIAFEDLDLSYININLDRVVDEVNSYILNFNQQGFIDFSNVLRKWKYKYEGGYSAHALTSFLVGCDAIHTTTFKKDLFDLVSTLPQLFNGIEIKLSAVQPEETKSIDLNLTTEEDDFSIFDEL